MRIYFTAAALIFAVLLNGCESANTDYSDQPNTVNSSTYEQVKAADSGSSEQAERIGKEPPESGSGPITEENTSIDLSNHLIDPGQLPLLGMNEIQEPEEITDKSIIAQSLNQ